jgi:hypothetical protein
MHFAHETFGILALEMLEDMRAGYEVANTPDSNGSAYGRSWKINAVPSMPCI